MTKSGATAPTRRVAGAATGVAAWVVARTAAAKRAVAGAKKERRREDFMGGDLLKK
jgi:hypothetical protein